jgi:Microcystin-dependent protein
MATYIKTLKEDNGDIVYPQTTTDAIYTTGGETLETRISKYVTAEDIAQSVAAFGTITAGMIDWTTMVDKIYPVGSIYMSATLSTAAAVGAALGGTWVAWGAGRVPVGVDTSDVDFDTAEETGGEKTHTLTTNEMPKHSHSVTNQDTTGFLVPSGNYYSLISSQAGASTGQAGGDQPHNNLQPYITCYMYKRTA